jgi:hypothetical protein
MDSRINPRLLDPILLELFFDIGPDYAPPAKDRRRPRCRLDLAGESAVSGKVLRRSTHSADRK